ncbi:hypothetical protein [Methylobacterium goesingense]|uniref:Uncharacterized protein n=1 Tax=Methylobacterium goesingense TaxID=243690 RepID=A0ABV2L9T6_9HYPH|nr:hypothetical protein [Methylobacterium goesingense]
MSVKFTDLIQFPVLIFGLVGPIGVDLEYAQSSLSDELKSFNYTAETITITSIMDELQSNEKIAEADFFKIYHSKIDYANDIRKTYEANDILAALAISAIRKIHSKIEASAKDEGGQAKHGSAYIIRQLKTPDEIKLLRSVYGRQFIQVSVHGSPFKREDYLTTKAKIRSKGTLTEKVARGGGKSTHRAGPQRGSGLWTEYQQRFPFRRCVH